MQVSENQGPRVQEQCPAKLRGSRCTSAARDEALLTSWTQLRSHLLHTKGRNISSHPSNSLSGRRAASGLPMCFVWVLNIGIKGLDEPSTMQPWNCDSWDFHSLLLVFPPLSRIGTHSLLDFYRSASSMGNSTVFQAWPASILPASHHLTSLRMFFPHTTSSTLDSLSNLA